jgi:hypothetical protein
MSSAARKRPPVPVEFREPAWGEEVERLDPRSLARAQAERARREIEGGQAELRWERCEAEGPHGTRLPGCRKLYVPLGREGASAAPFGFVFRLTQNPSGLSWVMIAFGERHPDNPQSKSVYARAHKRLHGHYP